MENLEFTTKRCNTCGEESPGDLNYCRYCGSALPFGRAEHKSEETQDLTGNHQFMESLKEESNMTMPISTGDGEDTSVVETKRIGNLDYIPISNQQRIQTANTSNRTLTNKNSIPNGMKVLLSVICAVVPGLGQLICLILAIIFINTEGDEDKSSFGIALLVASLVLFVLTFIVFFLIMMALYQPLD